jgi:hypothetical protein
VDLGGELSGDPNIDGNAIVGRTAASREQRRPWVGAIQIGKPGPVIGR